jgi:hypothetical protein
VSGPGTACIVVVGCVGVFITVLTVRVLHTSAHGGGDFDSSCGAADIECCR